MSGLKKGSKTSISAINQITMSLTNDLAAEFLAKLQTVVIDKKAWLNADLLRTGHMRLSVKLSADHIKSNLPISRLIKQHKATLLIKARKDLGMQPNHRVQSSKFNCKSNPMMI